MTEFNLSSQGQTSYTIEDLLSILRRLLAPDGCPWDRVQTHESLRRNIIEEAYETVDAIDSGIYAHIKEELGDVLLQVVFHAAIAERDGEFSFADVTDNISRKLISRHTHVFGEDEADSPDAVLSVWDKNKMKEKGHTSFSSALLDVPACLPALMRADKLQKCAAKAGFDWPDAQGALAKITEELTEIQEALAEYGKPLYGKLSSHTEPEVYRQVECETGDFLFAAVNYARLLGIDPEVALNRSNQKFMRRFTLIETIAAEKGRSLEEMSLEDMDHLWDAVKAQEKERI